MVKTRVTLGMVAVLALVGAAGCTHLQTKAWVESSQVLTLPADALNSLAIETHNGQIKVTGAEDASAAHVVVSLKAGGATHHAAEQCRDAIEIVSEPVSGTGHRLAWRWREPKRSDWSGRVSFDIVLPSTVAVSAETHNGEVTCEKVAADCRARSHNGAIRVASQAGAVDVETHNGRVDVACGAKQVRLITHNGGIEFDASCCRELAGEVVTHNGSVCVKLGPETATRIDGQTHNGSTVCKAQLADIEVGRNYVRGAVGQGGGTLRLESHNGAIRIE